jgi:secreted trypsin-like serine protease
MKERARWIAERTLWAIVIVGALVAFSAGSGGAIAAPVAAPVVNGAAADEGEWPFMVALIGRGGDETDFPPFRLRCGGTLVHPRYVLTAAHCVTGLSEQRRRRRARPSSIEVLAGSGRLTGSVRRLRVDRIVVHPEFDPVRLLNDVALVRLKRPIDLPTISLLSAGERELAAGGTSAVILGWGFIDPEGFPIVPDALREAVVPVLSDDECAASYELLLVREAMLCAGDLASERDAEDGVGVCFGDSGGPLLVHDGTTWRQAAVTSWAFDGCSSHKFTDVFAEVANYSAWVDSVLDGRAGARRRARRRDRD